MLVHLGRYDLPACVPDLIALKQELHRKLEAAKAEDPNTHMAQDGGDKHIQAHDIIVHRLCDYICATSYHMTHVRNAFHCM